MKLYITEMAGGLDGPTSHGLYLYAGWLLVKAA